MVHSSWCEDPDLTVSLLRERPSVCDVVIKLGEDAARNLEEPGVAGVYWADGMHSQWTCWPTIGRGRAESTRER